MKEKIKKRRALSLEIGIHYFFHDERTASASVEVVEGPT
jgi:hypothetical protein